MIVLSLRARLTLWYSLVLLAVLGAGAAVTLWGQERIGLLRVDRGLSELSRTVDSVVHHELGEEPDLTTAAVKTVKQLRVPGRAMAILDAQGQPLAASWDAMAVQALSRQTGSRTWTTGGPDGGWRVHAAPSMFGGTPIVVLVGTPLADVERERHEVIEAMGVGVPILILVATSGGFWIASIGLRPITAMAERASLIPLSGMDDLGESGRHDELGQLARAFNDLVARLRAALQAQRQFMADASHELRTPVSVIRSATDVTLARDRRDESEYRDALGIIGGEAHRVGRLVEDMLTLARADAGGYPLQRSPLYLDELVSDCRRAVGVLARERGVALQGLSMPEMPFVGDDELLRRMFSNVLQNAVQHTPSGRSVTVQASSTASAVVIDVSDEGPGITPADAERIFDRFVQADPARRSAGSGLGLPIARWIAEAHGGSLELRASGPAGSTFRITLPRDADAAVPERAMSA